MVVCWCHRVLWGAGAVSLGVVPRVIVSLLAVVVLLGCQAPKSIVPAPSAVILDQRSGLWSIELESDAVLEQVPLITIDSSGETAEGLYLDRLGTYRYLKRSNPWVVKVPRELSFDSSSGWRVRIGEYRVRAGVGSIEDVVMPAHAKRKVWLGDEILEFVFEYELFIIPNQF